MASTRSTISPGVFASAALTAIPTTPVAGVSYRDPVAGVSQVAGGWPFSKRVNSAEFNEQMYRYSTLISSLDTRGILGYTNLINYAAGAVVLGSDNIVYQCAVANGPGSSVQDPVSAPTYWRAITPGGRPGHVYTDNDWAWVDRQSGLIEQWGQVTISTGNGDIITLPTPFNNAILSVTATDFGNGCNQLGWARNGASLSTFRAYGKQAGTNTFGPTAYGYVIRGY